MMGGKNSKQRPEPVEGLDEDTSLSVVPVFRTSIRVRKVSTSTKNTFFRTVKIFTTLYSIQDAISLCKFPRENFSKVVTISNLTNEAQQSIVWAKE